MLVLLQILIFCIFQAAVRILFGVPNQDISQSIAAMVLEGNSCGSLQQKPAGRLAVHGGGHAHAVVVASDSIPLRGGGNIYRFKTHEIYSLLFKFGF